MTKLTPRDAEIYVATGGRRCPFCEHDVLAREGSMFYLEEGLAQFVRCVKCGKAWREFYQLSGIMYEELINGKWDIQEFNFPLDSLDSY